MRVFTRLLMFIASLLSSLVSAQSPVDPSGHWTGIAKVPDRPITLAVDLSKKPTGELTGTYAQPDQGLKALPLTMVSMVGRTVHFVVKGNDQGSAFAGVLSADGQTMAGDITMGDYVIPFELTRTGDARIAAAPISPAIAPEFEGLWQGTLAADGTMVQIELRLANRPDGTATGTVASPNGSGVEIPVAIVQTGERVTITIDAVGASFAGALNAAGSALTGSWSQQSASLPLTLSKAKR